MSKQKKLAKAAAAEAAENEPKQKVVMVFSEDKFYNDLSKPLYEKGKPYEIVGADMIQRWLKRGGEIVKGELKYGEPEKSISKVVESKAKPAEVLEENVSLDMEPAEEQAEE